MTSSAQPTPRSGRSRRGLAVVAVVLVIVVGFGVYLVVNAAKTTPCDNVQFRTASGAGPAVHGRPPLGSGGLTHLLRQAFHGASPAVYCNDFPDPFVLRVGGHYYLYSTQSSGYHVPVLTTNAITGQGSRHDALPKLPPWSVGDEVWAPSVLPRGPAYVMYYATHVKGSTRLCVSAAVAVKPAGPFVDRSTGPLVCPSTGAIDPSPFTDVTGQAYLFWKNDAQPGSIAAQPLDVTGLQLVGAPAVLLTADQPWERNVVEAPSMVRDANRYYLFYSGGHWNDASYAIGYAVCTTPLGPCAKPLTQPWLASNPTVQGPGGQEFFTDSSGQVWMVLHAWVHGNVGYPDGARNVFVLRVDFAGGVPRAA